MTSEDTDWLKNNFGSEPDVAYPGYYGVEDLPGLMKIFWYYSSKMQISCGPQFKFKLKIYNINVEGFDDYVITEMINMLCSE